MPEEMEMETKTETEKEKEQDKLSLLETWRQLAYASAKTQKESDMFWANYFNIEKGIYEEILKDPENPVCGTVAELADKFGTQLLIMTGFLDGINESLKTPNPIETMTEDTVVSLEYDIELLYKNMVEAKAEWLYTLDAWNTLIPDANRRKELYKEQKSSHTIVKDKKVGRNDPCPCGSGRKYKHCCGK